MKIPTIIFINKMDRIGASYAKLLKELKSNLSDKIVRLQNTYEVGSKVAYLGELFEESEVEEDIINVISKLDNELLEAYARDIKISKIELENKVSFYAKKGLIYPVLCGSGLLGLGVENLLEEILRFLPKAEENNQNRLSAVVFKIQRENFYDTKVQFSETMTIYKETPIGVGSARAFIYESSLFAAGVGIVVELIKRGTGVKYESKVSYGSLSKPFKMQLKRQS